MEIQITKAEDGRILRSFLKETLALSARTLSALKRREGGITLNGKAVTVRTVLHAGDVLSLLLSDERSNENLVARDLPLTLLYEDGEIAVCAKSGDMPTHPSHGHYDDTLANALAFRYRASPYVFRAITRLDRETSGVVLTARTALAAERLSRAMQAGEIEKTYLALVCGTPPTEGEIALSIRRRAGSVMLREVHPDGAPAVTRFRRLATDGEVSLLAVLPRTGRTHQIRLHLSHMGFPILGDCLYGEERDDVPRTMLHAVRLTFPHPASGERMTVAAPIPDDLAALLILHGLPVPRADALFAEQACPSALPHDGGKQRDE